MKMTDKIGGVFEVYCGSSFSSSIFLKYWVPVSIIFKIFILIPNFILVIFQPFFLLDKRESHKILTQREKVVIGNYFNYQNGRYLCQIFPYDEGVMIKYFFTLKTHGEKNTYGLGKIFGFRVYFGFWIGFLCFLKIIDWFNKIHKVFWIKN